MRKFDVKRILLTFVNLVLFLVIFECSPLFSFFFFLGGGARGMGMTSKSMFRFFYNLLQNLFC